MSPHALGRIRALNAAIYRVETGLFAARSYGLSQSHKLAHGHFFGAALQIKAA